MKPSNALFLPVVALYVLLSAQSCTKILNDELPEKDPKLVVNGIINPDSVFKINLSRTFHVFEDESSNNLPFIGGASVRLLQDGINVAELEEGEFGYYSAPGFQPTEGHTYKIEVDKAGFPAVESETFIPQKIWIESVDTSIITDEDEYGYYNKYISTSLKYQDPPNKENFYRLDCFQLYQDEGGQTQYYRQYIDVDDIDDNFYDSSEEFLLWSDLFSDGELVDIKFNIYPDFYGYYEGQYSDTMEITYKIILSSLTKGYYQYEKSVDLFYSTGGSDNPFSQPVLIYTNIENGYGIFGGFSTDTASLIHSYTYDY